MEQCENTDESATVILTEDELNDDAKPVEDRCKQLQSVCDFSFILQITTFIVLG